MLEAYRGQHLLADSLSAELSPQLEDCCNKVAKLKESVSGKKGLLDSVSGIEKLMGLCQADFQSLLNTNIVRVLSDGLRSLVAQLDAGHVNATYEQLGDAPNLVPEMERHCLEIAREACANAIKHGKARRLSMLLRSDESGMKLSISDNGSTEDSTPGAGGKGMLNMQRRAESMGASVSIRSNSYGGKTLELTMTEFNGALGEKRVVPSAQKNPRAWFGWLGPRFRFGKTIKIMMVDLQGLYPNIPIAVYETGKNQWVFELDGRQGSQIDRVIAQLEEFAGKALPADTGGLELLHKGQGYAIVLFWADKSDKQIVSSTRELLKLNVPAIIDLHHELGQSLHDSYCQGLVGASMAIQTLMESLDADFHELWQRMKIISLAITKSLQKARELSHALMDYGQGDVQVSPFIS